MSWDIYVQDFPANVQAIADIPSDFEPAGVGKTTTIIEKIKAVVPSANFSDPAWGVIEGPDWSIEVNLGEADECSGFALHVRGSDTALGVVAAMLNSLGLRALDSQTGEFFQAPPSALESFHAWRKWRDHVIDNSR